MAFFSKIATGSTKQKNEKKSANLISQATKSEKKSTLLIKLQDCYYIQIKVKIAKVLV